MGKLSPGNGSHPPARHPAKVTPPHLPLRYHASGPEERNMAPTDPSSSVAENPRFHLFVIDTGWKSEAAQAFHDNIETLRSLIPECPIFLLTREQSRAILLKDPQRIGYDPCLILHDLHAKGGRGASGYHGFRLSLGTARKREDAVALLQEFLRFAALHRDCSDIEAAVRRKLHREGLANAIQVLRQI